MAGRQRRDLPLDLARATERFAKWRHSRALGERIPGPLWRCAVDLAGRYGVSRTASALRIGYYELQKRLTTASHGAQGASPVSFVELPPVSVGTCLIEFENASGCRMRVQLQAGQLPDLVALGRSFWDARR